MTPTRGVFNLWEAWMSPGVKQAKWLRAAALRAVLLVALLCPGWGVWRAAADTLTITPNSVTLDDRHREETFTAVYSIPNIESGEPQLLNIFIDDKPYAAQISQSGLTVTATFKISCQDFPDGTHTIKAVGRKDEDDPVQDSEYDYPETMTTTAQFKVQMCSPLLPIPVDDNGNIQANPEMQVSTPNPTLDIAPISFTISSTTDPLKVDGQVRLRGTVRSGACDLVSGALGTIDHLDVFLDETGAPIAQIPVQVNKQDSPGALNRPYPFDGTFDATITLPGLTEGTHYVVVQGIETVYKSIGQYEFEVDVRDTSPGNYPPAFQAAGPRALAGGSPEDTRPTVLRIDGDEDTLSDPGYRITVGSPDDRQEDRMAIKWADLSGQGYHYYVADSSGSRPEVTLLLPTNTDNLNGNAADDPFLNDPFGVWSPPAGFPGGSGTPPPLRDSAYFLAGFVVGFCEGGVETVTSVLGLLWSAAKLAWSALSGVAKEAWKIVSGHVEEFLQDLDATGQKIKAVAQTLWDMYLAVKNRQDEVIEGVMTGNYGPLKELADTAAMLLQMATEMIEQAWNNYLDLVGRDPYTAGRQFGNAIFQIASLFIPGDALVQAGSALARISKAKFIETLIARLGGMRKIPALFRNAIQRVAPLGAELARTRMCFTADTPVVTPDGLRPIAMLRPGDLVLARNPRTGVQEYRPVLDLVATHPTTLYRVRYRTPRSRTARSRGMRRGAARDAAGDDHSGDDPSTETLTCTGEHPFWAVNRGDFIPAVDLKPGDQLLLASGETASVEAIRAMESGPAETFTTYNIEVDTDHTYFVGDSGVWVHNSGQPCEVFFSIFRRMQTRLASQGSSGQLFTDVWEVLQITFQTRLQGATRGRVRVDITDQFMRTLLARFAQDFGTGGLYSPASITYDAWKTTGGRVAEMRRLGLQGHHWWPKHLGGADGDGLVMALATPYAHTSGPRSIHGMMRSFLCQRLNVTNYYRDAVPAFRRLPFAQQKQLLQDFYGTVGLRTPNFRVPGKL